MPLAECTQTPFRKSETGKIPAEIPRNFDWTDMEKGRFHFIKESAPPLNNVERCVTQTATANGARHLRHGRRGYGARCRSLRHSGVPIPRQMPWPDSAPLD